MHNGIGGETKSQIVKSSGNSVGFSFSSVKRFVMTNMTAIIIPDIVVIKPHVSFSKLNTQHSVQMHCNRKSRSRAAAGAFHCDV